MGAERASTSASNLPGSRALPSKAPLAAINPRRDSSMVPSRSGVCSIVRQAVGSGRSPRFGRVLTFRRREATEGTRVDLQRFRDRLPTDQRDAIDLKAAWLRYLGAGGLDEDESF